MLKDFVKERPMSELVDPPSPEHRLLIGHVELHGRGVDWFLQTIVDYTRNGIEAGITLTLQGQLVSGTIISAARYHDLFADQFASAFPEDQRASMAETMRGYKRMYGAAAEPGDATEEEQADVPLPNYIHLRDATIWTGSGRFPSPPGLWRGKAAAVAGFSLGTLSQA
jgi:hypothetical protein